MKTPGTGGGIEGKKAPKKPAAEKAEVKAPRAPKLKEVPTTRDGVLETEQGSYAIKTIGVPTPGPGERMYIRGTIDGEEVLVPADQIAFSAPATEVTDADLTMFPSDPEAVEGFTTKETAQKQRRLLGGLVARLQAIKPGNKKQMRKEVLEVIGHPTPEQEAENAKREQEARDVKAVLSATKLAKDAGVEKERAVLRSAEHERFEALKDFIRQEAIFNKIRKLTDDEKIAFSDVKKRHLEATEAHATAQLAYARQLQKSMGMRLLDKYSGKGHEEDDDEDDDDLDGLTEEEKKKKEDERREKREARREARAEAVFIRYNRLIRFREIVKPSLDLQAKARLEVAGEKSKNIFEKMWNGYKGVNQALEDKIKNTLLGVNKNMSEADATRFARIGARTTRLLGFAALGATAGTGLAIAGAGGIAASAIGGKVLLGLAGIGSGSIMGWGYGAVYEKFGGGKRRADEFAAVHGEFITNSDDLENQEGAYMRGSAEAIARARAARENIFAFVTSFGVSASSLVNTLDLDAIRGAAGDLKQIALQMVPGTEAPTTGGTAVGMGGAGEAIGTASAPEVASPSIETAPTESSASVPEANDATTTQTTAEGAPAPSSASPESTGASVSAPTEHGLAIEGRINNADRLVGHFGVQLQEAYPDPANAPASVKKLFELLSTDEGRSLLAGEDKATLALGLQGPDGLSAVMQPGDTIGLDDQGNIVFDRPGSPEVRQVLISNEGEVQSAAERVEGKTGLTMRPSISTPDVVESVASETSAPATEPETSSVPAQESAPAAPTVEQAPAAQEAAVTAEQPPAQTPAAAQQAEAPRGMGMTLEDYNASVSEAEAPEVITSRYGAEVDPTERAVYQWRIPNTDVEYSVAYGPNAEMEAKAYAIKHPDELVMYEVVNTDPVTGTETRQMNGWSADENGIVEKTERILDRARRPFAIPDPNDFVKKLTP